MNAWSINWNIACGFYNKVKYIYNFFNGIFSLITDPGCYKLTKEMTTQAKSNLEKGTLRSCILFKHLIKIKMTLKKRIERSYGGYVTILSFDNKNVNIF